MLAPRHFLPRLKVSPGPLLKTPISETKQLNFNLIQKKKIPEHEDNPESKKMTFASMAKVNQAFQ
jgi:hypothetical protein